MHCQNGGCFPRAGVPSGTCGVHSSEFWSLGTLGPGAYAGMLWPSEREVSLPELVCWMHYTQSHSVLAITLWAIGVTNHIALEGAMNWGLEENRDALGTEDRLVTWQSEQSLRPHSLCDEPNIRCCVQLFQLQTALRHGLSPTFPLGPPQHSAFLQLPQSHSSGIWLPDWIWLPKLFRKSGDFKSARNYQGSMALIFKYKMPTPPETEVWIFHDV